MRLLADSRFLFYGQTTALRLAPYPEGITSDRWLNREIMCPQLPPGNHGLAWPTRVKGGFSIYDIYVNAE